MGFKMDFVIWIILKYVLNFRLLIFSLLMSYIYIYIYMEFLVKPEILTS
jgi:hypothetical protein